MFNRRCGDRRLWRGVFRTVRQGEVAHNCEQGQKAASARIEQARVQAAGGGWGLRLWLFPNGRGREDAHGLNFTG